METKPREEQIIKQSLKLKKPIPERIQNAPELDIHIAIFYRAFQDLNTCRSYGMGEGPIPWTAIAEYVKLNDLHGELRDDIFYHVRHLDDAYLKIRKSQREKEG